jgi:hypothetical protein
VWTRQKNGKLKFLDDSKSLQDDERLTEDEKEFLSMVERLVWVGRYPIPITERDYGKDLDTLKTLKNYVLNLKTSISCFKALSINWQS